MLQSRVSYSNLLVLIQLSSSESRIQFNGFAAYAFDFLSKMSFLLTSRTSEQGSEFPASGELREVFARSAREILLVARLARLIANPGTGYWRNSRDLRG